MGNKAASKKAPPPSRGKGKGGGKAGIAAFAFQKFGAFDGWEHAMSMEDDLPGALGTHVGNVKTHEILDPIFARDRKGKKRRVSAVYAFVHWAQLSMLVASWLYLTPLQIID